MSPVICNCLYNNILYRSGWSVEVIATTGPVVERSKGREEEGEGLLLGEKSKHSSHSPLLLCP